jgi:hypothetical protein
VGTTAEFRRNAHECIELANQTGNEVHRKTLLGLAATWLRLAGATRDEMALIRDTDKQSSA